MITRYRIIDSSDNEIEVLNTIEEAVQYIDTMRETQPHLELRYETFEISLVKPGFGRDPELH
tara:strand:+ start:1192 stop:1377 length:186 start_codon:yes stop_codon:yes gene_type:complete